MKSLKRYKSVDLNENSQQLNWCGTKSYGYIKLYYHKKLDQHVVGKFFSANGNRYVIEKRFADAEREAKILARLKHPNIVHIIGTIWTENQFGILLECLPCGNLENILTEGKNVPLPWKIRVRFFAELASALNYLHHHDHNHEFVHGDLKSQNVLLGNKLEIKLADFGATSIAKHAGVTSTTNKYKESTQHTPYYTAPEYLSDPIKSRCCSMDVYSYGMIGYEILTRERIFSASQIPFDVLVSLIITRGQKPSENDLEKIQNALTEETDQAIFHKLNEIVHRCWQFEPDNRPDIADVKKELDDLVQSHRVYDKTIDADAELIVQKRNLKLPIRQQQKKSFVWRRFWNRSVMKSWRLRLLFSALMIGLIAIGIKLQFLKPNYSGNAFLATDGFALYKHVMGSGSFITLLRFPTAPEERLPVSNVVKVNEWVYVISQNMSKNILRANLTDSSMVWEEIEWDNAYKLRNYIAFKDSILAVGALHTYSNSPHALSVDLYNTTTQEWIQLPNLNETRRGHALVIFKGLLCAVGGVETKTSECLNMSTGQWTYLPPMKAFRQRAAAVELNGKLYVIGGDFYDIFEDSPPSSSAEKFDPVTGEWIHIASTNRPRINHAALVYNDDIFVVGGYSSVVEVYNSLTQQWDIAEMLVDLLKLGNFISV